MKAQELFERVTDDLIAGDRGRRVGLADAVAVLGPRHPDQRRRATVPRMERAGVGDGRSRARLVVEPLGDLPRVAAPRLPGPSGRTIDRRRAVEADRPPADADQSDSSEATTRKSSRGLFARVFNVFAAEQVDGADRFVRRPRARRR